MIDRLNELFEHPALSIAAGATVATAGALNKWVEDVPLIHDILSDSCMAIGFFTCCVGFLVQIRNYRIRTTEEKMKNLKLKAMLRAEERDEAKYGN